MRLYSSIPDGHTKVRLETPFGFSCWASCDFAQRSFHPRPPRPFCPRTHDGNELPLYQVGSSRLCAELFLALSLGTPKAKRAGKFTGRGRTFKPTPQLTIRSGASFKVQLEQVFREHSKSQVAADLPAAATVILTSLIPGFESFPRVVNKFIHM